MFDDLDALAREAHNALELKMPYEGSPGAAV